MLRFPGLLPALLSPQKGAPWLRVADRLARMLPRTARVRSALGVLLRGRDPCEYVLACLQNQFRLCWALEEPKGPKGWIEREIAGGIKRLPALCQSIPGPDQT